MISAAAGNNRCGDDWKQKMMSEKIAFLTMEINLTPEEAQIFWPVYNQINSERDAAMNDIINTFHAMKKAIDEGKSEKEIAECLNKYIAAQEKLRETDNASYDRYIKVLSVEKVAKLYVAEEKFRRNHIRSMKEGTPKQDGNRPGNGK